MPFLCPYGCGEGYDTKDKCDRHEKVCARGIAQRCRQQEWQAPAVPQDQHPPGADHKPSTVPDSAADTAAMSDAVTATMRGLPLLQTSEGTYGNVSFSVVSGELCAQQVPNQVNYAMQQMSEDAGSLLKLPMDDDDDSRQPSSLTSHRTDCMLLLASQPVPATSLAEEK